jgi:hypothetical protein
MRRILRRYAAIYKHFFPVFRRFRGELVTGSHRKNAASE